MLNWNPDAPTNEWRAKFIAGTSKTADRVELRRSFKGGSQTLVIVALDGWDAMGESRTSDSRWRQTTQGYNVRLSMNSCAWMRWDDTVELVNAVNDARDFLEERVHAKNG